MINNIGELFSQLTAITPEQVENGDWILIEKSSGFVIHRVQSVEFNDGNYDLTLLSGTNGLYSETIQGTTLYLICHDPIPYETVLGSMMFVTTSKFSTEVLVVRTPQNHWMVIDKDLPQNFTEAVYDSDILNYREIVEGDLKL